MIFRALIAEPADFSQEAVSILQTMADVELQLCTRENFYRAFADYDVIWFRLAHPITEADLDARPRCRILATAVTGLGHVDLEACSKRGVQVVSLKNETEFLKEIRATAELALAITLALMRRIPDAVASVKSGSWNRDAFRGEELYGKTVGIVGVGRLGSIIAGYFKALGCTVLGYDPCTSFSENLAQRANTLAELLQTSDVVTIHVDLNSSTRKFIGRRELAFMRPHAFLVNTSRGGVVDEDALIEALESGRLAGAALDVLDGEPDVDIQHPLIALSLRSPRLLIVPHIGGSTKESLAKSEVFLAHKVVQALRKLA